MGIANSDQSPTDRSKKILITEANRCVSCGLCLPHCPTYRLLQSEADCPRGRIAMMNGVASGRIPLNKKFVQHMERCLACRACESVCPNNVAYGQLIDEARKLIRNSELFEYEQGSTKLQQRDLLMLLEELVSQPARLERLRWLLYLSQKCGLLYFLHSFKWLQKLKSWRQFGIDKMLKQLPPVVFPYSSTLKKQSLLQGTWQTFYPAEGSEKGKVGLFLGCIARLTDAVTLNSSIFVLNRLGFSVCVPKAQTCCGALHQHAGDTKKAAHLMQNNKQAFAGHDLQVVISTASGCGAQLIEYNNNKSAHESEEIDGEVFPNVLDISKFLVAADGWDKILIKPLRKKIAVQDPCSLRNVLGDQDFPYQLLRHIPDAELIYLADNDQCCGAAGTYFIKQPELAGRLLDDKINTIVQSGAHLLVTSNVGCSMHIAGRLRQVGANIEVLHPVTLLAQQMGMK